MALTDGAKGARRFQECPCTQTDAQRQKRGVQVILSIDPGPIESAYVLMDLKTLKPIFFGKLRNEELIEQHLYDSAEHLAIEMIAHYGTGMPAGQEIFDTCVWIGRFWQEAPQPNKQLIYRKDEKMNLCQTMKAKDSNIRQALIDRFGVVGTKKNPGWFYGFKGDVWQSYAVGVTYHDLYLDKEG